MPHLSGAVRCALRAAIALPLLATFSPIVHAQNSYDFVPVADTMLENPSPDD